MVNRNTLNELERLGFGGDIDALESYVATLQDAAGNGEPLVTDSVYDQHFRLLKELKPESEILSRNWETADFEFTDKDEVLKKYGMCSITTVQEWSELGEFLNVLDEIGEPVTLAVSVKENGHGVRAIYTYGELTGGSTRGRYKRGRDITRHLRAVLPTHVSQWDNIPLMEVRGEMLVSIDNFEKHLKNTLKTPLSSVTSLIRDSVSDEELRFLDMLCYKVISANGEMEFGSLHEEYSHLVDCGFRVPPAVLINGVTSENLQANAEKVLEYFESKMDKGELPYSCDGLVFTIDDNETFYSTGKNGNSWRGNFALKIGRYWASNVYSSIIREIQFIPGKSYLTPKASIDPVVASTGATITTVPLYNVGVMERYGYTVGEEVFFKFGGETGVTLCDANGESVRV